MMAGSMRENIILLPWTISLFTIATPTSSVKIMENKKKSLKYCCVCKGIYRGKVTDGRTVSLHRFPQNKRLKRVWIQRCRTVMKSFVWSENRLLCSEHFEGRKGPSLQHTLPSRFPTASGTEKIFPSSALDENQQEVAWCDEREITKRPCSDTELAPETDVESLADLNEQYTEMPLIQYHHQSILDISLKFHDYITEPTSSRIRMIETQTCIHLTTTGTQTESVRTSVTTATQTGMDRKEAGEQTSLPFLAYEDVMDKPAKLNFYTGIPNKGIFNALFDEMGDIQACQVEIAAPDNRACGGRPRALRLIDEFFMVLMRLRLGLLVDDLADRFCISSSACSRLLNKWIDYLDFKLSFLVMWPSKSVVQSNMPKIFRDKFPETRVIIDCTEIRTETPSSLLLKSMMYSDYKSHNTWKSLVGISPSGHVTFVSDLWVGSISDKQLTKQCGIVDMCEKGDSIMVDKGFTISDLTTPRGIKLIIPPFKHGNTKFSKREVEETRSIANARIHVERQMERIKNFRIVQGVMPISLSQRASKVWKICARLTNLQPPLVPH